MTLHEELLARLGDPGMEQLAGMLGTDQHTARFVLQTVSGTIVGGLARNTRDLDGAEALRAALDDHADADPFNGDVASLMRDGQNILGHVLGGRGMEEAATVISRLAGVDPAAVMKILPLTAPMVMTLLATLAGDHDMDAEEVATLIDQESKALPDEVRAVVDDLLADIYGPTAYQRGYGNPLAGGTGPYGESPPGGGPYGEPLPGGAGPYGESLPGGAGPYGEILPGTTGVHGEPLPP
ncbi:DUF937 domain-containing protein [Nonomuraea indica]|uniref:DUF937 domain-containing protein n=1 Tax=Nonomuraea indica TaxID=1581193 RepID=A0ABW8A127_9ACTN